MPQGSELAPGRDVPRRDADVGLSGGAALHQGDDGPVDGAERHAQRCAHLAPGQPVALLLDEQRENALRGRLSTAERVRHWSSAAATLAASCSTSASRRAATSGGVVDEDDHS